MRQELNEDITDADNLVELLKQFFKYHEPQHEGWVAAAAEFPSRLPDSNTPPTGHVLKPLGSLFFRVRLGFAVLV